MELFHNINTQAVVLTSFSNLAFLIQAAKLSNLVDICILTIAGISSTLHHVTTTSHDLVGFWIRYSIPLLWLDRLAAIVAIGRSIYLFSIGSLWTSSNILLYIGLALFCLFVSDIYYHRCYTATDIRNYAITHSLWHILAAKTYRLIAQNYES